MAFSSFVTQSLLAVVLACVSMITQAAGFYFDIDIYGYSEAVPIVNAINEWDGPFTSGTDVFSHDSVEMGAEWGKWHLGVVKRYDYELKFSESTAEFYYYINNKIDLVPNRTYDLDIVIRHTYSDGVRLSYDDAINRDVSYKIGLSYLRGLTLTDGYIKGRATTTANRDYNFQFDVSYVYSKDTLFDRNVDAPRGAGMALDAELDWRFSQSAGGRLSVRDLYSFIRWYDAPYTTAVASSDTKTYDNDGYVVYKPIISGIERYRDFTQRIPLRAELMLHYGLNDRISALAAYNVNKSFRYYQLGLGYKIGYDTRVSAMFIPRLKSLSINYHLANFLFSFISDSVHINDARSFGLRLAYQAAW